MSTLLKQIPTVNALIRRFPVIYQAAREQISRFEEMDLQQRADHQAAQVRTTLKAAGHGSAKFQDLPFVEKAEVRANPARFQKWTPVPAVKTETSGTSGVPLRISRSLKSVVVEQATIDWVIAQAGHDFARERIAVLRAARVQGVGRGEEVRSLSKDARILDLPTNDLSPETLPAFIRALETFQPQILYVMPSAVEYFVDLMAKAGISFGVPLIFSSSDVLPLTLRRKMRDVFGATVIDFYGQAERVCAAYSMREGDYRFLASYGVAELISRESGWEIAGTALHNRSQFLVRYLTGDLAQGNLCDADIAAISLGVKPFDRIEGRRGDELVGRDGRMLFAISNIPGTLQEYGRFQFVQDRPNKATIFLAGWSEHVKDRPDPVIEKARLMLPEEFELDVRFVDRLECTAAGKTPFIIKRF
ncbi:MAG: AMP-binding protein [Devosia sp.]